MGSEKRLSRSAIVLGAIAGVSLVGLSASALLAACSDGAHDGAQASSGDGANGGDAAPFVYRGAGCAYDVSPPERNGFQELTLDDPVGPGGPGAEPVRVRIGLGGEIVLGAPGYADPSRTAVFTWETPSVVHAARIRLGESEGALSDVRSGFSWITPPPEVGFGMTEPATSMHEVHVCGLSPGRTYYYQVGGGTPEVWSATQSFTTVPSRPSAPTDAPITVGILGDARDDVGVWQRVQMRMRDRAVNLQITTGDLVFVGTQQSLYDQWLGAIWKDPSDPQRFVTLGQQMMVMVAGNHENEAARFYGAFAMPGSGPFAETHGSFDVGAAHFVVLDDQTIALLEETEQAKGILRWLDEDLRRAEANRKEVPFLVVVHHRGLFTTSNHGSDSDVLAARRLLAPIYDRHHVDVVVNGHDHAFERSLPLRVGTPPEGAPSVVPDGQGTVYVVNAGAGATGYGVSEAPFIAKSATYGSGTAYDGLYGIITLEARKLTFTSYALTGSGADPVIDTFDVTR